jgi:RNA polymerase sigma-70 factor, ECF subfamily
MSAADTLAALYTAYQGQVFGFCYHLTGNQADAEDLTQETFLRALGALRHTQIDGRALRWLHFIARNLVRDAGRRQTRWTAIAAGLAREGRTSERPPDVALLRQEDARDLLALLEGLRPEYRRVLLLAAAGTDLTTTARLLGRSPGAIKALRWRARQAAQRALRAQAPYEQLCECPDCVQ